MVLTSRFIYFLPGLLAFRFIVSAWMFNSNTTHCPEELPSVPAPCLDPVLMVRNDVGYTDIVKRTALSFP